MQHIPTAFRQSPRNAYESLKLKKAKYSTQNTNNNQALSEVCKHKGSTCLAAFVREQFFYHLIFFPPPRLSTLKNFFPPQGAFSLLPGAFLLPAVGMVKGVGGA